MSKKALAKTEFPTGDGGGGTHEPGFDAVKGRFGRAMVDRIKNWPRLAENHCLAADGDEIMVADDVRSAERNVQRARNDADYALDQAEKIARHVPESEWDLVPSVAQLKRDWHDPRPPPPSAEVEREKRAAEASQFLTEYRRRVGNLPPLPKPDLPMDDRELAQPALIPVNEAEVAAKRAAAERLRVSIEAKAELDS